MSKYAYQKTKQADAKGFTQFKSCSATHEAICM